MLTHLNKYKEIKKLWKLQLKDTFPHESAGIEIDGLDLVLCDTYAAGCIETYVLRKGRLDDERVKYLVGCQEVLSKAVETLKDDSVVYFDRLLKIVNEILVDLELQRNNKF